MIKKLLLRFQNDNFLKGAIFLSLVSFLGALFNYVVHPLVARGLTVAQYGDFQALLSFLMLVGIIDVVLSTAITKEVATLKSQDKLSAIQAFHKKIIKRFIVLGVVIFCSVILLSLPLKHLFKISSLSSVILTSTILLYNLQISANQGILAGLQKFFQLAINSFLSSFFRFFLILTLVYCLGWQLVGASMALGGTGLLALIYGFYQIKRINFPKPDHYAYNLNFLFKYSFLTLVFLSVNQLFSILDMLVVKAVFNEQEAGFYGGLLTVGRIVYFIGGVLPLIMFPLVAEQTFNKSLHKYKILIKSLVFTALAVAPVVILMISFPELIIKTLVGEKFLPVAGYLPLFTLPMALLTFINILSRYFLALEQKRVSLILIAGVMVELLLLYINHNSIGSIISSMTIAFSLVVLALLGWLLFCFKRDKIILISNQET